MKRGFTAILVGLLISSNAHAQLIIQQGQAVNSSATTQATPKKKRAAAPDTGPVEAVIEGTNFPASAISSSNGQAVSTNELLSTPAHNPANDGAPVEPVDSDVWPRDTGIVFVTACAKNQPELIKPCKCVIQNIVDSMSHKEFIELAQTDNVEADSRYVKARTQCLGVPKQRQ